MNELELAAQQQWILHAITRVKSSKNCNDAPRGSLIGMPCRSREAWWLGAPARLAAAAGCRAPRPHPLAAHPHRLHPPARCLLCSRAPQPQQLHNTTVDKPVSGGAVSENSRGPSVGPTVGRPLVHLDAGTVAHAVDWRLDQAQVIRQYDMPTLLCIPHREAGALRW